MKEQLEVRIQQRIEMLYRYTNAMECGDTDMVAVVLEEAQHDNVLERMILEVNEVYQIEDRTVAHPDDVVIVQEMVATTFAEHTTDVTEVQSTPEAAGHESDDIPVHIGRERAGIPPEISARVPSQLSVRRTPPRKWYRSRISWLASAVAVLLIALLLVPGTGALADQFLSLFRVQEFQPVATVERPEQLVRDVASVLRNFGAVQWDNNGDNQPILTQPTSNVANVEKLINFQPQLPTSLPDGTGHVAQFSVSNSENVTFVFDQAKTESYLQKTGQSDITIPASLTGAKFHVTLSNGLAVIYYDHCQAPTQDRNPNCASGNVSLGIGEIPSPVISAEGNTSFADLRSFLLSLPKLSPDLHNLIEQTDVKSGIIPVPVPAGANAQQVNVKGVQGLLLSYGKADLIVWQEHGLVYLVTAYGSNNDQLLNTANSFQ